MTYKKKICLEKSMITSTSNQQMKNLMLLMKKAKARNEQELFVVEGRKMFQEVPEEWLKQVYVSESFLQRMIKCLQAIPMRSYQILYSKRYQIRRHRRGFSVWSESHSIVWKNC